MRVANGHEEGETYGMNQRDWQEREVVLGNVRYPYFFGFDCADRIAWQLGQLESDGFVVVTDDTVLKLHGETLLPELAKYAPVMELSQPPGEDIKTLRSLSLNLERAVEWGATRASVVVAFGGGVPGNLAGLMAGLLYRGVRLVHVPTTTVAAMDSTISLKQAVNSGHGKNHFGLYHAPKAVLTDVRFMQTLPEREVRSGLGEAAKNCLAIRPVALPALREMLAAGSSTSAESLLWLLDESLRAKTTITLDDPREQASGLALEYGHTVGHALEIYHHRTPNVDGLSHGEAVALGMKVASRVAASLGYLDDSVVGLHDELVSALGGPTELAQSSDLDAIMEVVKADNKRGYLTLDSSQAAMVLLRDLGKPAGQRELPLVPVGLTMVREAVTSLVSAR
jgi:3-dehydroquinate synthase/2-deoxy-scyllo-inosose synthase